MEPVPNAGSSPGGGAGDALAPHQAVFQCAVCRARVVITSQDAPERQALFDASRIDESFVVLDGNVLGGGAGTHSPGGPLGASSRSVCARTRSCGRTTSKAHVHVGICGPSAGHQQPAGNAQVAPAGLDSKLQALAQLFEIASTTMQMDHPLCLDCYGQVKDEVETQVRARRVRNTLWGPRKEASPWAREACPGCAVDKLAGGVRWRAVRAPGLPKSSPGVHLHTHCRALRCLLQIQEVQQEISSYASAVQLLEAGAQAPLPEAEFQREMERLRAAQEEQRCVRGGAMDEQEGDVSSYRVSGGSAEAPVVGRGGGERQLWCARRAGTRGAKAVGRRCFSAARAWRRSHVRVQSCSGGLLARTKSLRTCGL